MVMLCYVLAALCLVYCVGVVATKAAGTKFYLIWLAGAALFGMFGFFVQKGLWMRLPIGLRAGIGMLAAFLYYCVGCTDEAKRAQRRSGKTAVSGIYLSDRKSGDPLRIVRRTGQ